MSVGGAKGEHLNGADGRRPPGQMSRTTTGRAGQDGLSFPALDGATVLLVEDDPLNREALDLVFSHYGAIVFSAASAAAALAEYERIAPSIVVSDILLPDGDGCAVLRTIRTRELDRHMPAIAVSGSPGADASDRAYAAGFDVFFSKPVSISALLQAMQNLIERAGR